MFLTVLHCTAKLREKSRRPVTVTVTSLRRYEEQTSVTSTVTSTVTVTPSSVGTQACNGRRKAWKDGRPDGRRKTGRKTEDRTEDGRRETDSDGSGRERTGADGSGRKTEDGTDGRREKTEDGTHQCSQSTPAPATTPTTDVARV